MSPNVWRDRLAVLLALLTIVCLGTVFFLAESMRFLSPGPLTSAHSALETCSACHTTSGKSKLSWISGLVAGDPDADSNACLTCHKMPDTAFNAHSASVDVLEQSTKRLAKIAAKTRAPHWTKVQDAAFPTHDMVERGIYCSTCHQEHKGANFNLTKISNERCNACHVVKFDAFDGKHPQFESYPFKQRTKIIYDHFAHAKRIHDIVQKTPAKRVPTTCSSCHNDRTDRRIMSVGPFEQTCSSCHLGQITGKERVSGPKGLAFLALPGLDLDTLRKKNAPIGEWPADSEAELTPFMKVMISRSERGRDLIRTVDRLNLRDLSDASDEQIKAVTDLAWEVKGLFYALISGKVSDVLGSLNISCGAKLSANLIADLTASIPRDVIMSAQQQWLPNLGTEMANRQDKSEPDQGCWIATIGGWVTTIAESGQAAPQIRSKSPADADSQSLRIDAHGGFVKRREDKLEAAPSKAAVIPTDTADTKPAKEVISVDERPRAKAADQTDDLLHPTDEELRGLKGGAAVKGYIAYGDPDGGKETPSANEQSRAFKAGIEGAAKVAQADGAVKRPAAGGASRAADQTDDLLSPTEEELRGLPAPFKDAGKARQPPEGPVPQGDAAKAKPDSAVPVGPATAEKAAPPAEATGKADTPNAKPDSTASVDGSSKADAKVPPAPAEKAAPEAKVAPVISIQSDVDAESWAEYGGWYRQDYTIFYRPTGHKDKLIYSWLFLTGPQAAKGDRSPAAAVFDLLTSKEAQGTCTKCHSVDDIEGKGRLVNFSPRTVALKQGRFTRFVHEPHFGVLEDRGCLTCHSLAKGNPYLQSFEQGDPGHFASNFASPKKELCQTCHTSGMARQDCLLCHKYHLNGATTPMMNTRVPAE